MAKRYYTEDEVKRAFLEKIEGRKQAEVAADAGVKFQHVSAAKRGGAIMGGLLKWLGYKRVTGLFERVGK